MKIRKATKKDLERCMKIAKGLPEWFNEKGIREIAEDLANLQTYVYDDGAGLGYACVKNISDKAIEIKQLAVERNNRRKGMGEALLKYVENIVAPGKTIEVKT